MGSDLSIVTRIGLAPVALATGLWPVVVVLTCLGLSIAGGHVPACNPFIDGCTSISRAGRHGWAWFAFKAGMLPYATLLAFYWLAAQAWLRGVTGRGSGAMITAGLVGAVFLVLYATFLGSDGAAYRVMRRYGINVYFGGTWLAQALMVAALWRGTSMIGKGLRLVLTGGVVAVIIPGLVFYTAGLRPDIDRDRLENTMEWAAAALMQAVFVATAAGWWRSRLAMRISTG